MGLPIWGSSSSVECKSAIKADVTAASRSPIRRPRSVSTSRRLHTLLNRTHELADNPPAYSPRSHAPRTYREHRELRHRELARNTRPRLPTDGTVIARRPEESIDATIALRPDFDDYAPPPVPESRNYRRSRSPSGRPLSTERTRDTVTARMRPHARGEWSATRLPSPTLPSLSSFHASADSDAFNNIYITGAGDNPSSRRPNIANAPSTLSPDFAPARPAYRRPHRVLEPMEWPTPELAGMARTMRRIDEARSRERDIASLPPLQRTSRRSAPDGPLPGSSLRESWSPATTVDGLGDRARSMTPEQWDTMLETIAPDPQLPSADSSFTSAAASASFTNSHTSSRAGSRTSGTSAHTAITVPSTHGSEEVIVGVCETSDEEASDTDDEREQPEALQVPGRVLPALSRASRRDLTVFFDDQERNTNGVSDVPRNIADGPIETENQHHDFDRMGSLFRSTSRGMRTQFHDGPDALQPSRLLRRAPPLQDSFSPADAHMQEADLEHMRPFFERMARRVDIPEEYWRSVGLTPLMAQNIDRTETTSRARTGDEQSRVQ